jgi:hypothetical protein
VLGEFFKKDDSQGFEVKFLALFVLLLAFSLAWQSSELPFLALDLANLRISLLFFLDSLAFRRAYFLRTQSWQT